MTPTLVAGTLTGLSYALLAIGLVLVYKAARFLNLAHAQLGIVSALLLAKLVSDAGWNYWVAFAVAVAAGVAVGVLAEVLIVRRVKDRTPLTLLLTSLGIAQLLLALTYVQRLAPNARTLAREGYPVPFRTHWTVGGFVLRGQHVLILVLAPLLAAGLALFMSRTRTGRAIRAVASNPDEARLCGIAPERVHTIVWGLAGGLSAITAVLQAPGQGSFNLPALGPSLLLRALGAAAIGGFTSLPLAAAGGLAIGLVEHTALRITSDGGVAELAVLALVVVALLVRSRAARGLAEPRSTPPVVVPLQIAPVRNQWWWVAAALAGGVLLPLSPPFATESNRFLLAIVVTFALLSLALTVVLGWAGQISLGHFALLGIGAYIAARLEPHGWSMPLLMLFAGVVGAAIMTLAGLPIIRLPGVVVAVTTLGFALVAPQWLFVQGWFGSRNALGVHAAGLVGAGRPTSELGVYYVALATLAIAMLGLRALRSSTPGRLAIAARDNPQAVATLGFEPVRIKLALLAVSGFIAALAGVLWATAWHTISADLISPQSSLIIVAAPVIGGVGSLAGAVLGAVFVFAPQFFLGTWMRGVFGQGLGMTLLLSGVGLVSVQLWLPSGLAGAAGRLFRRPAPMSASAPDPASPDVAEEPVRG